VIKRIIVYALVGAFIAIPIPIVGPIVGAIIGGGIAYFLSKRERRGGRDVSSLSDHILDRKRLAQRMGIERVDGRFYLGHESYETLEDAIAAGERKRLPETQN
jgi:hypothetical protein